MRKAQAVRREAVPAVLVLTDAGKPTSRACAQAPFGTAARAPAGVATVAPVRALAAAGTAGAAEFGSCIPNMIARHRTIE
mmetsp:Transcript_76140/g.204362  ORF Transcript_76140/g.204362 Transcript_76140/m.204362 type:complete len:80 (-) Transcript_76140:347-586(-)